MVYRIYVAKKPEFANEANALASEIKNLLKINGVESLSVVNRYDVENIDETLFEKCIDSVFSEPQIDNAFKTLPQADYVFAVEPLPGQFDQRADSAAQCIQLISQKDRPTVRTAKVYAVYGNVSDDELLSIKKFVINPVESREAGLDTVSTLKIAQPVPAEVAILDGFTKLDRAGLEDFVKSYALAMDADDIAFCQQYFISENRDPSLTEIRMIDTYWFCSV